MIEGQGSGPVTHRVGHFRRAARGALRVVMPPSCLSCGLPVASDGGLCPDCWGQLTLIEEPFCDRLAIPFAYDLGEGAISAEAIADPPPFERLRAVAVHDGTARSLVHALKYRDHLELARWMAEWMARAGRDLLGDADLIVPVPLHSRRLWWRRFNQAAALAHEIGRSVGVPVAHGAVRRVRATRNQVGLSGRAREDNVRGAFLVASEDRPSIAGRRVVVVDDVYTTGATIGAVTRSLKRAGAKAEDALVFARVAPRGD